MFRALYFIPTGNIANILSGNMQFSIPLTLLYCDIAGNIALALFDSVWVGPSLMVQGVADLLCRPVCVLTFAYVNKTRVITPVEYHPRQRGMSQHNDIHYCSILQENLPRVAEC